MLGNNRESKYTTTDSPKYDFTDKGLYASLSLGASMMALTIGGMLVVADTILGELMMTLYQYPIVGVGVFGALLTVGRHLGIKGVKKDSTLQAAIGSVTLILAYSWFGGGILTQYDPSLYNSAILVTGVITIGITLIASAYVYSTDKDLSNWSKYSGILFIGAIVAALIGTFFAPIALAGFALALLGFIADLVYEIWMTSQQNRPAHANGIALYVAFAGVFVHVLQLVLELMASE